MRMALAVLGALLVLGFVALAEDGSVAWPTIDRLRDGAVSPMYIYECWSWGPPDAYHLFCCRFLICKPGWGCWFETYCCWFFGGQLIECYWR